MVITQLERKTENGMPKPCRWAAAKPTSFAAVEYIVEADNMPPLRTPCSVKDTFEKELNEMFESQAEMSLLGANVAMGIEVRVDLTSQIVHPSEFCVKERILIGVECCVDVQIA